MNRPSNKQLSEFVREFDKLTHARKMSAIWDLMQYASGDGAPYGIIYELHPDNR
ncbi:hypothetical protein PBI_ALSFRO_95 [Mycobacterium phage Alsfro]|uniref:hypothetical protein n=1 Tax=Mycobacterium phage Alsfro TaxID=1458724 RepID=UPI00042EAEF9|nr:hypothetical protein PBI_ALSFRO_95 [Mycobacterium phage Alsfro]AHK12146.1 hypothetical protein PBI_ALSFRO_95 [Mycobacterium phage Alsfro]USH44447.1 hypothetical protein IGNATIUSPATJAC_88 [Mycobacterium phage IgnatiusPatJac]